MKARLTANTLGVVLLSGLACVVVSSQASPGSQGQAPAALPGGAPLAAQAGYVGSASCRSCHAEIYARWSRTPMANVVTDPRQHPENVLPDFSKPDPLLTFKLEDVAFVIEPEIADVMVRRHTFRFITPTQTDVEKIPNPCTSCHTDRTTAWARQTLVSWAGVSPSRVN